MSPREVWKVETTANWVKSLLRLVEFSLCEVQTTTTSDFTMGRSESCFRFYSTTRNALDIHRFFNQMSLRKSEMSGGLFLKKFYLSQFSQTFQNIYNTCRAVKCIGGRAAILMWRRVALEIKFKSYYIILKYKPQNLSIYVSIIVEQDTTDHHDIYRDNNLCIFHFEVDHVSDFLFSMWFVRTKECGNFHRILFIRLDLRIISWDQEILPCWQAQSAL